MSLVDRSKKTYNSSVAILTVLTLITGIGSVFYGFLFVPFAAAFYAMILLCESYGKKRIFSYLIPVVILAFDAIIHKFYIVGSASVILIGFFLFYLYARRVEKFESVFILAGILFAFYIASFILLAVSIGEKLSLDSDKNVFVALYDFGLEYAIEAYKSDNAIVAYLSQVYALTPEFISDVYKNFVFMLPPLLFVFAIVSVGISSKMYTFFVRRFTKDAPFALKWRLHTSTLLAIVFIVASILKLFVGTGIFGICVSWIYTIFAIIYAYLGVKFVYQFISLKKSTLLAVIVIAFAFLFLSSFAYQLASYAGAYYVISVNRRSNFKGQD